MRRKLTTKQELFVIEYAKDFNATQAAIRAGYSARNADKTGPELLGKTREFIEEKKASAIAKANISLDQWVQIVTKLALYDPRKLFDKFGNPQEIPELGRLSAMAIAGFEVEELYEGEGKAKEKIGYCRKVKLLDRTPYVIALGKYLGAFPTAAKHNGVEPVNRPPRFDPTNLTKDEWLQMKQLYQKMQIRAVTVETEAHNSNMSDDPKATR
ncbi:MAG: terminase small subunit [Nitrospira sp.]|nr:terminase small subunit [Nitrospira sp.]